MKLKIQLLSEASNHASTVTEIATFERACKAVEDIGLTLAEAKALLAEIQTHIVQAQIAEYLETQRACAKCERLRPIKGYHPLRFRTAFGDIHLQSPRWHHCMCESADTKTYSPLGELLTTHTAPELLYLESTWAALIPYGAAVRLLQDVLPIGESLNRVTVRNHLHGIAERMEADLGPERFMFVDGCRNEWEAYPEPDGPITVGLDGGYVRGRERKPGGHGQFEVIAGKSITAEGNAKCFALVNSYDRKPKRRLFEVLKSQGMQPRQQVTFLSDGGDTVRKLQEYLNPESEHLLDWAGSRTALPPSRPQRTARASFPARGSSLCKVVPVVERPDRVVDVKMPVTVRVQKHEVIQPVRPTFGFWNPVVGRPARVPRNLLMAHNATAALLSPKNA